MCLVMRHRLWLALSADKSCEGEEAQASDKATARQREQFPQANANVNTTTIRQLDYPQRQFVLDRIASPKSPWNYELRCTLINTMRAVLPGKPRAKLQAVCTGCWDSRRLIVSYIPMSHIWLEDILLNSVKIGVYHRECFRGTHRTRLDPPNDIRR